MNLREPFKTTILIIFLSLDLLFLSFLIASKNVLNKDYLSTKVRDFNFTSYVKERDYVESSSRAYKYPLEVFNYIDMKEFYSIIDNSIDRLLSSSKPIIYSSDIFDLLNDSVTRYDSLNHRDSYVFVRDDLMRISSEFSYKINNDGLVGLVKIMLHLSNILVILISIAIAITLSVFIYLNEKRNGILINGIVYILYSFYLYYFNANFLNRLVKNGSVYTYFNNFKSYDFNLGAFYIICFILGFVLLLIYIVMYIKKVIRDVRLNSYESWR